MATPGPGSEGGADFSDVGSGGGSTSGSNAGGAGSARPDFSDVQSGASSTAPAQESGTVYTVKSGDTLRKIAQHFYGDEMKWPKIRDANRAEIPNPDRIQVGMKLTIPPA